MTKVERSDAVTMIRNRRAISEVLRNDNAEFVVLIGSWARRGQRDRQSDIDLLVGRSDVPTHGERRGIHVVHLTSADLLRRVSEGDDFAQWCLRFGVPLSGRRRWDEIREAGLKEAPWPDPSRKLRLAVARAKAASELLAMGDLTAAEEQLATCLGHLGRGLLLMEGEFPLSRPELPDQLRGIGYTELGTDLEDVSGDSSIEVRIEQILSRAWTHLRSLEHEVPVTTDDDIGL